MSEDSKPNRAHSIYSFDDATSIRERFDQWETKSPDKPTREIWLALIDPYL